MTYLIGFLCAILVLKFMQELRQRNKQNTFEWQEGDQLSIFFDDRDRAFVGMYGKYVIHKGYCNTGEVERTKLRWVLRNISLDERKAKEYMKFREELHKENV